MPFILISNDFGNTSNVAVHAVTNTRERGEELFATVLATFRQHRDTKDTLLELVEVPFGDHEDYVATADEGRVLFWNTNRKADGITVIRTNNGRQE